MSMDNGQLRDVLEAAVGEPLRRISAESVRRRAHRRQARQATTAALAATAVVCVSIAAAALARETPSVVAPVSSQAGDRASVPPYFVQETVGKLITDVDAVIRATATGAITGTVRCPGHDRSPGAMAAAGQRTFFMACSADTLLNAGDPIRTWIYRFQVTAAGRATTPVLVAFGPYLNIAAAAGGSVLAATVLPKETSGPAGATGIALLSTRTGQQMAFVPNDLVANGYRDSINDLSLSASGRELAFYAECVPVEGRPGCASAERILVLRPGRGPVPATANGRVVPIVATELAYEIRNNQQLSPDGSALTVVLIDWRTGHTAIIAARYSVRTGRMERVLYRKDYGKGIRLGFADIDSSGEYVLLDSGGGDVLNGWADHGRLAPLPPAGGLWIARETW